MIEAHDAIDFEITRSVLWESAWLNLAEDADASQGQMSTDGQEAKEASPPGKPGAVEFRGTDTVRGPSIFWIALSLGLESGAQFARKPSAPQRKSQEKLPLPVREAGAGKFTKSLT